MKYLAGRGGGEARVDALELRELLDGPKRNVAGGNLLRLGLAQLQDPEVLADAGLRGPQPLGDALHGRTGVDQALVAAGAGEGVQVAAKVILDQGLDEQVDVLVIVTGADPADDRWKLHHRRLHGRAVPALGGDQDIVPVLGRTDADRLQAAVLADRLSHLLEVAIVGDLAARVEPFGDAIRESGR
jgi:hypothetical protein